MFKVLIVDDEVFVRKGLQKLIPWEKYKFSIAGEAKHGGEALEMIKQLSPDLVVTDIMMPVLDGLGLIRTVREAGENNPEFIIISGYNEFKYAQQAIRYNVQDYILKPVDVKEMETVLQKLAVTIHKKRLTALTREQHVVASILEALMQGHFQEEVAVQYEEALAMELQGGSTKLIFAWILVHQTEEEAPGVTVKEMRTVLDAYADILGILPVLEHRPGQFGILLGSELLLQWNATVYKALEEIRGRLCTQLSREISIYAGDPADSLPHLNGSYLGANEALKQRYAEDASRLLLYGDVKTKPLYHMDMDQQVYNQLLVELEEDNKEACRITIDRLFEAFRGRRFTPSAVAGSLSRFFARVLEVVQEMNGETGELRQLLNVMEEEYYTWTLQGLKDYFWRMVMETADCIARIRKGQHKGDIEKIKKYIDSHFADNMNLKSIASLFFMNPVYLGQLFRKTYGVYFNDYLLELRVEEAKKLLRLTDLRMYEIAERVGIRNANYFVSQFEKLVKLTPMEYRNKLVQKE